jgi:hypothetical protein
MSYCVEGGDRVVGEVFGGESDAGEAGGVHDSEQRSSQKSESAGDGWHTAASLVLLEHGVTGPVDLVFHAPVFSDESRYGVAACLIGVSAGDEEAAACDVGTSAFFVANVANQTGDLAGMGQREGGRIGELGNGARSRGSRAERVELEKIQCGNGTEDECSIACFGGQVKKGEASRASAVAAANFG